MNPEVLKLENESEQLKVDGKNDEAIAKLTEAIAIDGNFARLHLAIAVLYTKTGKHEKACEHAERAVELEPGDTLNMTALSLTYQQAFEGTRDPAYIEKAETALAKSHGM